MTSWKDWYEIGQDLFIEPRTEVTRLGVSCDDLDGGIGQNLWLSPVRVIAHAEIHGGCGSGNHHR